MTSTIKVNKIQDSCGSALVTKCGSTITLGASGKTVAIAGGASTSGMGRAGAVDWCTTAKTSPLTGVSGKGYFVNTTGGVVTVTLPSSPSAGDIIAIKDYAKTFATNGVTICRAGSKISSGELNPILNTNGQTTTLVYVDATQGWLNVQTDTTVLGAPSFITATGGTITTSGDFKIHTFTSDGNFDISSAPNPSNNNVSYLVVGGGGGSGSSGGNSAGGAGAGGFREGKTPATPYTASPLVAPAGLPVSVQSYPITVGAGGAGSNASSAPEQPGTNGVNSIFSSITSAGGGYGAGSSNPGTGGPGGSGGGGAGGGHNRAGGSGNTPSVSPAQGFNGGTSPPSPGSDTQGGGGGGAGAVGTNATTSGSGSGGNGVSTEITGSAVTRGGGGAGGSYTPGGKSMGSAGSGGGGGTNANAAGDNGTANTGGGGGGPSSTSSANGATGGSGIVVIRYKFQ